MISEHAQHEFWCGFLPDEFPDSSVGTQGH